MIEPSASVYKNLRSVHNTGQRANNYEEFVTELMCVCSTIGIYAIYKKK